LAISDQQCDSTSKSRRVPEKWLSEGHELVRIVLGDDYISVQEVETAYCVSYTDEQLKHFADTFPDIETILLYRSEGFLLMPKPWMEMNLLQIGKLDNNLFYPDSLWWNDKKFVQDDMVKAIEWLVILKEAVPNSFSKTWNEQQRLLTEVEYVPNAAEVSYAVITYYKTRGVYLLAKYVVRSSSFFKEGLPVSVGYFLGTGTLNVGYLCADHLSSIGGVSSARK